MKSRLAAAALFLAPGVAGAGEIELPTRIDTVTVYPDGAIVTRRGKAQLLEGASRIVLRGLPAAIDAASIRIEGRGDGPVEIGAVDIRKVPGDGRDVLDQTLQAKLDALLDEQQKLAGQIGAIEAKRATIERFGQAGPDKLGADGKALPVADWQEVWDAIGTALVKVNEELRGLRNKAKDVEADIAALERARPTGARTGAPRHDVAIAVAAATPVAAEFSVSYRVSGASWLPVYEARLSTGSEARPPEMVFVRRAELRQRTGEDWTDAALLLSTTRASQGTHAPDLAPLPVDFVDTAPPRPVSPRPAPAAAAKAMAEAEREEQARQRKADSRDALLQQAQIEAGAYQASFAVPGRSSIPQDGTPRMLVLSQRTLAPELQARTTPELDQRAYLEVRFAHEEEAPLLPGKVLLHRDGSYVGSGRLVLVPPGEKVELGFGADDRIKVTRTPVQRRQDDATWFGQTRTDQREFRTVVKSLHARPVRVTVQERIPVSENGAITVETLPQTTPPTEKQVGDKRGVSAWTFDLAPGKEKDIRVGYRLKWPADRELALDGLRAN